MSAMHSLVVFLPERGRPGALAVAARKYGLTLLEGCGDPRIRASYADRAGVLLTLTAFDAVGSDRASRVSLPEAVQRWVGEALAVHLGPPIEVSVLTGDEALKGRTHVSPDHLARPLSIGHRYLLSSPGPGA